MPSLGREGSPTRPYMVEAGEKEAGNAHEDRDRRRRHNLHPHQQQQVGYTLAVASAIFLPCPEPKGSMNHHTPCLKIGQRFDSPMTLIAFN